MANGKKKKTKVLDDGKSCMLCRRVEEDEARYGKLFRRTDERGEVRSHYFCLLFACGLAQSSEDDQEGIQGFLLADIRKEINRAAKLKCKICKEHGASTACIKETCNETYHYPCGREKNHSFVFAGNFASHCNEHKARRKLPRDYKDQICVVCQEGFTIGVNFVKCPQCQHISHQDCVQRYALTSGYFFKCFFCSNKKPFKEEAERNGVYVPKKDADWELSGQFNDQVETNHKCKVVPCVCPDGIDHHEEGTMWDIVVCDTCGGESRHAQCGSIPIEKIRGWHCSSCAPAFNPPAPIQETQSITSQAATPVSDVPPSPELDGPSSSTSLIDDEEPLASTSSGSAESPLKANAIRGEENVADRRNKRRKRTVGSRTPEKQHELIENCGLDGKEHLAGSPIKIFQAARKKRMASVIHVDADPPPRLKRKHTSGSNTTSKIKKIPKKSIANDDDIVEEILSSGSDHEKYVTKIIAEVKISDTDSDAIVSDIDCIVID